MGIGYSLHAGQVTVADGTEMMAKRIERVLTTDPGMGVIRHVDAGYEEAKDFAKKTGREGADGEVGRHRAIWGRVPTRPGRSESEASAWPITRPHTVTAKLTIA